MVYNVFHSSESLNDEFPDLTLLNFENYDAPYYIYIRKEIEFPYALLLFGLGGVISFFVDVIILSNVCKDALKDFVHDLWKSSTDIQPPNYRDSQRMVQQQMQTSAT